MQQELDLVNLSLQLGDQPEENVKKKKKNGERGGGITYDYWNSERL